MTGTLTLRRRCFRQPLVNLAAYNARQERHLESTLALHREYTGQVLRKLAYGVACGVSVTSSCFTPTRVEEEPMAYSAIGPQQRLELTRSGNRSR